MRGSDQHDQTPDVHSAEPFDALCREFEAAWQEVPRGGTRPRIEDFVVRASEPDRSTLDRELRRLDDEYQARQPGPGDATAEWIRVPDPDASAPTVPEEAPPPPVVRSPNRKATLVPGMPPTGATLEYVSAPDPLTGATLAPGEAPWSVGDATDFTVAVGDSDGEVGGPVVAGYQILGELGRGAMGVVYKARQTKLNRVVALKMVLAGVHAGAHQLARFQTEAEAVARLQHPNIVQIYEVGEHDGLPFFSLEFIDGESLSRKIAGKPQPPREAAGMVELLALAMAAAHDRGVIHRDLKPANVLLTADGLPKITDFGLAKRLEDDSSQTRSGTLLGTPSYMSPEQARGDTQNIGPLSDLYALGAILYEQLTGRAPFVGATLVETVLQVRQQEPVPPRHLNPKVPRDVETICLKCLQKEPGKRYVDCQALADDLRRFQAGEPIRARPTGLAERAWRWCRRNPGVAALCATVGVLVAAVVGGLVVMGVRYGREREAVAETRKVAGQRLELAAAAIAVGDSRRAADLLRWSDPLLASHPALADVRSQLDTLRAQVDVYADFKRLLDDARFACRFGSRQQKQEGHEYCRQLLELYDEIERQTGRASAGLPPLSAEQDQLFKEDVFEAFLVAAQVEGDLAAGGGEEARTSAARRAIDWLGRAEQVLPGTRALYVHRAPFWATLGNREADKADIDRALAIPPTSAVDHFWHGVAEHLRGDEARARGDRKPARDHYHQAIAEYAAFLQQRPDHFWGYFNWAYCHAQLNERPDLHDAVIGFTACMRLRPDFPWPYNNRGTAHLRLGEADLAVADFTAALARNDHYAEAYANRGLAQVARGRPDEAVEDFGRAVALDPHYAPAYTERAEIYARRGQYDAAAQDYTRLLALRADKAPLYAKRADAYRRLKRDQEAIRDYDEFIALRPKDLQARAARADLCIARGEYQKAREDLTQIVTLAPKAASIWRTRAVLNWQKLKAFDAALEDLEQYAELEPNNAEPYRCMGAILLGRRSYDRARAALDKAVALKPDYAEALWCRAQIALWQNKPEEALKDLDPLVAKLPEGPPETLNVRGDVHRALGRLGDAAADYRRMIALKPNEPDAYVSLAQVYEKQGEPDRARECYERLVRAAPEAARSYLRRAEFRRSRGDFDGALADCGRAAEKEPGSALPALVRASIEAARGQAEAAVADAEHALARAPENDGRALYAAACAWSLASGATADRTRAGRYADRAAALLGEALDKGYHDLNFPEHNRMADDPALAPIRQVPRVRDLLAHRG